MFSGLNKTTLDGFVQNNIWVRMGSISKKMYMVEVSQRVRFVYENAKSNWADAAVVKHK
jgi:hypothetical protein